MATQQTRESATRTVQPDGTPPRRSTSVEGYVDAADPKRVTGWACDRATPDARIEIEIEHEGKRLVAGRADQPRPDLRRAGIGDGCHAFQFVFDPPLHAATVARLVVLARSADGDDRVPLPRLVPRPQSVVSTHDPQQHDVAASNVPITIDRQMARDIESNLRSCLREWRQTLAEQKERGTNSAELMRSALAEIATRQEAMAQQISGLEVFQARLEATLAQAETARQTTPAGPGGDRKLRAAVAALAILSACSFAIGLFALWQ